MFSGSRDELKLCVLFLCLNMAALKQGGKKETHTYK